MERSLKVWNGINDLDAGRPRVVATIGNYDGVHRGHQSVLKEVIAEARRRSCPAALITFDPHPLAVVAPERRPDLVQTRGQKLRSLEETGLDEVLIVRFTAELAALDGDAFFETFLLPSFPLAALRVGTNFRFGKRRAGDFAQLQRIAERQGFDVDGTTELLIDNGSQSGDAVSSSAIRDAVRRGEVSDAQRMLGRPFALTGLVARGEQRGRELGFPTANLETDNMLMPRNGVYITEVRALAGRYPAMTNIGLRPTFGGERISVETHLLDFNEDLYGQRIEVSFLERLREEQPFSDASELADQLARDRAATESYFSRIELP